MTTTFLDLGVDDRVAKNLPALGIHTPNALQAAILPRLLEGDALLVKANTNSGKTALAVIPTLHEVVLRGGRKSPQLLALTATRTVALEYGRVLGVAAANTGLRVATFVGSTDITQNIRDLKGKPELIAGAVGRTADLVRRGHLGLEGVFQVILDETDALVTGGIDRDLRLILDRLPANRRTICTSATFPDHARQYLDILAPGAKLFQFGSEVPAANVERCPIRVSRDQRFDTLLNILRAHDTGPAVIFVNYKVDASGLSSALATQRFRCVFLTGDLNQADRDFRTRLFNEGRVDVIVASDVLARGFHSKRVRTIVNWDVAPNYEAFLHRIGRAARVTDAVGKCYIFVVDRRDADRLQRFEDRIAEANQSEEGGDHSRSLAAPPATVVDATQRLFLGRRIGRPEVALAAFEQGGSLEPSYQPYLMELLGRNALVRSVTEVLARLAGVNDLSNFRALREGFVSDEAINDLAVRMGIMDTFAGVGGSLTPSQIFLRALGVLCVDGTASAVTDFLLRYETKANHNGSSTRLGAVPIPIEIAVPINETTVRKFEKLVDHKFADQRWLQMGLVGNAGSTGQLDPAPSLVVRGEAALPFAIVDELRTSRATQRPDHFLDEVLLMQRLADFWASKHGIALHTLFADITKDDGALVTNGAAGVPRDNLLYGLLGAIDSDLAGKGVHKAVRRLFPFVTQRLP